MSNARPDWDEYFASMASAAAKRSTCNRAMVGALLVKDKRIVASGYNGAGAGMLHCSEVGHKMVNGHCVRTIHAEMNAIAQAAQNGVPTIGTTMYCTHSPCVNCAKLMIAAGIKRIVYVEYYNDSLAMDVIVEAGICIADVFGNIPKQYLDALMAMKNTEE